MWKVVKKALNSTLGTRFFKSNDVLIEEEAYKSFFKTVETMVSLGGYTDCLIVPEGTKQIEQEAYQGNAKKVIVLPLTVEEIQNSAFKSSRPEKIYLSPRLESIGIHSLSGCTNLKTLTIPKSVSSIADNAFIGCVALNTVVFEGVCSTISSTAFTGIASGADIYVPWSANEVEGAPWGANTANIHYNSRG